MKKGQSSENQTEKVCMMDMRWTFWGEKKKRKRINKLTLFSTWEIRAFLRRGKLAGTLCEVREHRKGWTIASNVSVFVHPVETVFDALAYLWHPRTIHPFFYKVVLRVPGQNVISELFTVHRFDVTYPIGFFFFPPLEKRCGKLVNTDNASTMAYTYQGISEKLCRKKSKKSWENQSRKYC